MLEQSWKTIYSRTTIKSVPLLQPEHGFCQQNGPQRGQVLVSAWKKWWWFPFVWMVDVVIQGAWVLHRIKKDKGNESLPLLVFQRQFVHLNFLKFKGRQIFLELFRNSIYPIICLLWWPKTLPGAIRTQAYSEHLQTSKRGVFGQAVNSLKSLTGYAKIPHLRCLKGFWIRLCWKQV